MQDELLLLFLVDRVRGGIGGAFHDYFRRLFLHRAFIDKTLGNSGFKSGNSHAENILATTDR